MTLKATLQGSLAGAKGATGLRQRSGSGAPGSSAGEAGEYYLDTANAVAYGPYDASAGWPSTGQSAVGPKGAVGPGGASTTDGLGHLAPVPGHILGGGYSLSSSAQSIGGLGGGPDFVYVNCGTSLVGLTVNIYAIGNLTALNFLAYSTASNSVVWTIPVPTANLATGHQVLSFPSSKYPIPGPTRNYLQVTGSGSINFLVTPTYAMAQMVGTSLQPLHVAYLPTTTSYSATPINMGIASTALPWFYQAVRSAYLYNATIVNNSSGAVQIQLYDATNAQVIYTSPSMAANSKQVLGPLSNSAAVMRLNTLFYLRVIGSGTGSVLVAPRIIL